MLHGKRLLSAGGDITALFDDFSAFRGVDVVDEGFGDVFGGTLGVHEQQAGHFIRAVGGVFLRGDHLVEDERLHVLVHMPDAHVAD